MFHSLRIKNFRLILFSILCLIVLLAICLLMLRAAPPDTVEIEDEKVGLKIGSDADIEAFIDRCGYTVEGCISDDEVTVPKTWNDAYTAYNDLQKQQGFDLRPYKGKTARKLVYALTDSADQVTVLTTDDRIIAADICAPEQGSSPRPLTGHTPADPTYSE